MQRCMDIRRQVFIEEQRVPENIEQDGQDAACRHFAVSTEDDVVATCRIRRMGSAVKIERVAVSKDFRQRGIGKILMKYVLQELGKARDIQLYKLSAQSYTLPFYEKLGFKKRGGEYLEAGMPHYDMVLEKTS